MRLLYNRLSPQKALRFQKLPVVDLVGFWSDKNSELLTYCDAEIKFLKLGVKLQWETWDLTIFW